MEETLLDRVVRLAALRPGDARLCEFCVAIQEAENVPCEDRQQAVDYLVGELQRGCSSERSDVLMTLLYAITDVQRFPNEERDRGAQPENISAELLQSRSGQYLRRPRVLKDVVFLLEVPKHVDCPIRPQLKLLGLLHLLPMLDRASVAETLAYYSRLRELVLDPELLGQAVFDRASFAAFHRRTLAQLIARQPRLFFSLPLRIDGSAVLRLLEGVADAADFISASDIAYCLDSLAHNRLKLSMTSVVQVKMFYWALCQLTRRARLLLGLNGVAVDVPHLSAQDENAARALQIGEKMFRAWLARPKLSRAPLASAEK